MATKEQEITQIGHSVTIKGDISGNSDVRVAGNVIGGISIEGELIVERQGVVEADIKLRKRQACQDAGIHERLYVSHEQCSKEKHKDGRQKS